MISDRRLWLSVLAVALLVTLVGLSSCGKSPLHYGVFTNIGDVSISPDGEQVLFMGCGHKDYPVCTIYRFDRKTKALYRYIYPEPNHQTIGGRYLAKSMRFIFNAVPVTKDNQRIYNEAIIVLVDQDGTGRKVLTGSKGFRTAAMLNDTEDILVYARGKESTSGRKGVYGSDFYKLDLKTGTEQRLTRYRFYGVSKPYFTPDGRSIIYDGDSPMQFPQGATSEETDAFLKSYKKRYGGNIILECPLDGSAIDKEPVPAIMFGTASYAPMVTGDGSIWFEANTNPGGLGGHRRMPDGKVVKVPYYDNSIAPKAYPLFMDITRDGRKIVTLNQVRERNDKLIRIIDTESGRHIPVRIPATAENIYIQ